MAPYERLLLKAYLRRRPPPAGAGWRAAFDCTTTTLALAVAAAVNRTAPTAFPTVIRISADIAAVIVAATATDIGLTVATAFIAPDLDTATTPAAVTALVTTITFAATAVASVTNTAAAVVIVAAATTASTALRAAVPHRFLIVDTIGVVGTVGASSRARFCANSTCDGSFPHCVHGSEELQMPARMWRC